MIAVDTHRLLAFLNSARSLLRTGTAEAVREAKLSAERALTGDRLLGALGSLSPLMADARRSGAFANPWELAGLRRDEVRTAAVLAWLLDPAGSHGAGDAYTRAVWRCMGGERRFPLSRITHVFTEQRPLADERNRVDLVLEGPDLLVFIEVKIDAPLRKRQLEDYQIELERKAAHLGRSCHALACLSRLAIETEANCLTFHWRDLARVIRETARGQVDQSHSTWLALRFADHIQAL